jgi:hypothetical protein
MADEPTPTPDAPEPDEPTPSAEDDAAKWKALARKHEKEAKRLQGLEAEMESLRKAQQSDADKAVEKARKDAEDAARKDERSKADRRIVRAGVREVAATKLNDPGDALVHLDLEDFSVDDDGEVDRKAITKAIDELLKTKPYLAKDKEKPKPGSADGGARNNGDGKDQELSPKARLLRAYETSKT